MFVEAKIKKDHNIAYRDWDVIHRVGHTVDNTRGGSIVQCHPGLKMGKNNSPALNNNFNETLHFTIPFKEDKLHIFLIYIHPHSKIEETIFTKAALYKYSIIIGDFNPNQTKNKQINKFLQNGTFKKLITPPTFLMDNNPDSTPDLLLYSSNLENNIKDILLVPDLGSDHLAMLITLDLDTITEETVERKTLQFKKCKINKVNEEMNNFINSHKQTNMNEDYITLFNNKLSECILKYTPTTKHHPFLHVLPPFIVNMIKNKRKLYREYRNCPNPNFKTKLNEYNTSIHKMIMQYKRHRWTEACKSIREAKGKNFYRQINKLSKYKKFHKIPTILANNREYKSDEEKANIFAEHFKQAYQYDNDINFDNETERIVETCYFDYFNNNERERESEQIEEATYYEILHNTKNSAPGTDNIPWSIVKQLNQHIHEHIMKIYEWCLNNQTFPEIWKTGTIILIAKTNKDHKKVENYRPITLLPVLGKLLEKIIKAKLEEHFKYFIPKYQFGFRRKKATVHPLTIFFSNLQNAQLNNRKTAAVCMDTNKAFDSMWIKGLLYKLFKKDTPSYLIHIIGSYLKHRRLKIKIGDSESNFFTPMQGTPQGSPLSPLLYNIYCSDIPTIHNTQQYILQYADDTLAISHGKTLKDCMKNLQEHVNNITSWFSKWRLKANPEKSQLIIFNHNINHQSPTIAINNKIVKPTPSIKYLGIQIDSKASLKLHANNIKKKMIARAKHFRCLTYNNQGIDMKTATIIYKSICRPIIEYGHPLYANCRESVIKILEVAETTSLRAITKMRHPNNRLHNPPNHLLYSRTKVEPIGGRIEKLNNKFIQRLKELDDISDLMHDEPADNPRRKFPTCTLLQKLRSYINS